MDRYKIKYINYETGMVKVVDKRYHSFDDISFLSQKWLNKDYSKRGRKWFYANLKRYLVIEKFLEFNNKILSDYKFFCFNGKVELVQVDLNRFDNHVKNLYNKKFNRIKGQLLYPQGYEIPKPDLYEQALSISEKLSKDFDFIRVDLYILNEKIYFGELTNIPGNGFEPFIPKNLDFELGKN